MAFVKNDKNKFVLLQDEKWWKLLKNRWNDSKSMLNLIDYDENTD